MSPQPKERSQEWELHSAFSEETVVSAIAIVNGLQTAEAPYEELMGDPQRLLRALIDLGRDPGKWDKWATTFFTPTSIDVTTPSREEIFIKLNAVAQLRLQTLNELGNLGVLSATGEDSEMDPKLAKALSHLGKAEMRTIELLLRATATLNTVVGKIKASRTK